MENVKFTGKASAYPKDERFYTDRSLAIACTRGREAIVRRFHPLLSRLGFTEQQWRVMRVLHDFEPISVTDLCRQCCIHKVSMGRIISALTEKGLVTRRKHESDGRAFILSLTDLGRDTMDDVSPEAYAIYKNIRHEFGKENTKTLLALLKKLSKLDAD